MPEDDTRGVRQPRRKLEDQPFLGSVMGHVAGEFRPGPHPAHLAADDVEELGPFVHPAPAQPLPHPGDLGIGRNRQADPGLSRRESGHAAEFDQGKRTPSLTDPLLDKKDRWPVRNQDGERNQQTRRQEQEADERREQAFAQGDLVLHAPC